MINLETVEWGRMAPYKEGLIGEINHNIYQLDLEVEQDDIVVDIGASVGVFTLSILHKNPSQVYCIEPDSNFFRCLVNNTKNYPVTCLFNMIGCKNSFKLNNIGVSSKLLPSSIDYGKLLYLYNIPSVDFLKIDCEGCEYEIFSLENIFSILNTTKKIVAEFHLTTPELKEKFITFLEEILPLVSRYSVHDVVGNNITGQEYSKEFLNYYTEIIIYIDNR